MAAEQRKRRVRLYREGMRMAAGRRRGAGAEAASSSPWQCVRVRFDACRKGDRCNTRRQQIRNVAEGWRVELAQGVVGVHHPNHAVGPLSSQVCRRLTVQLRLHLVSVVASVQH